MKLTNITANEQLKLNDKQLEFYTLAEIHRLLRSIGKSLKDFTQMPQPPKNYLDCVKLNQLVHNMRINKGTNEVKVQRMKDFAGWVLNIGDGNIERAVDGNVEDDITIPPEFCNIGNENCIDDMIDSTFPDFIQNYKNPNYLSERAILTPTNSTVS
ncbi:hypothetical protein POM88_040881 [Heracleum sosnowskyi]|uniref:Uncharacterized protein n=1 Tax=Heracleum sosnowskyi TaxID=360622 RepID=A0AAD8HFN4_9APIA|nr:hypothetical protein POM88_040881 [Heracleum sosnowskyi]